MTAALPHCWPVEGDPVAWIEPQSDGGFSYADGESGVRVKQFQVIEDGDLIDVLAWRFNDPSPWWSLRGIVTHLGAHELSAAWWQNRPAFLVATPQDYLDHAGECFCVVDWTADVNAIIGAVPSVLCATPALADRLTRTLTEQAKPRIEIRLLGQSRAA